MFSLIFNSLASLAARAEVDPEPIAYGYIPTRSICFAFLIMFSLSATVHVAQCYMYRMWWIIPTILFAGVLEIIGWVCRLWSSYDPYLSLTYTIQVTCIIIGPTPLLAASFIITGALIRILGERYSRWKPRTYSRFFVSCDIIALLVQSGGGGIAAAGEDPDMIKLGSDIMLAGIVFQFAVIVVYIGVVGEYVWRYLNDKPAPSKSHTLIFGQSKQPLTAPLKIMAGALAVNIFLLFVRAIYRIIELSGGWEGEINTTEIYLILFDCVMVILAMFALNLAHPGRLIGRDMGNNIAAMEKEGSEVQLTAMA